MFWEPKTSQSSNLKPEKPVISQPIESSFGYFKKVGYKGFKVVGSVEQFINDSERFYNEKDFFVAIWP